MRGSSGLAVREGPIGEAGEYTEAPNQIFEVERVGVEKKQQPVRYKEYTSPAVMLINAGLVIGS